jgi:hypothetical protein
MLARGIVLLLLSLLASGCAQEACCRHSGCGQNACGQRSGCEHGTCCRRPGCALRSYCPYGYNIPAPPGKLGIRWWLNHPHRGLLWGGPVDAPFIDPYWSIFPWRNVGPANQCGVACGKRGCRHECGLCYGNHATLGYKPIYNSKPTTSLTPASLPSLIPETKEPEEPPVIGEPMKEQASAAPDTLFEPPPVNTAKEPITRRVYYGNHMLR